MSPIFPESGPFYHLIIMFPLVIFFPPAFTTLISASQQPKLSRSCSQRDRRRVIGTLSPWMVNCPWHHTTDGCVSYHALSFPWLECGENIASIYSSCLPKKTPADQQWHSCYKQHSQAREQLEFMTVLHQLPGFFVNIIQFSYRHGCHDFPRVHISTQTFGWFWNVGGRVERCFPGFVLACRFWWVKMVISVVEWPLGLRISAGGRFGDSIQWPLWMAIFSYMQKRPESQGSLN